MFSARRSSWIMLFVALLTAGLFGYIFGKSAQIELPYAQIQPQCKLWDSDHVKAIRKNAKIQPVCTKLQPILENTKKYRSIWENTKEFGDPERARHMTYAKYDNWYISIFWKVVSNLLIEGIGVLTIGFFAFWWRCKCNGKHDICIEEKARGIQK